MPQPAVSCCAAPYATRYAEAPNGFTAGGDQANTKMYDVPDDTGPSSAPIEVKLGPSASARVRKVSQTVFPSSSPLCEHRSVANLHTSLRPTRFAMFESAPALYDPNCEQKIHATFRLARCTSTVCFV